VVLVRVGLERERQQVQVREVHQHNQALQDRVQADLVREHQLVQVRAGHQAGQAQEDLAGLELQPASQARDREWR
jgi:hypothetical protein